MVTNFANNPHHIPIIPIEGMSAPLHDLTNLTPHPVTILNAHGCTVLKEIPSSGSIRLNENVDVIEDILIDYDYDDDIVDAMAPVYSLSILFITFEGDNVIADWPVKDNHSYIVSALVANAYPERTDFLMVAKTLRDENGRIKGCTSLARATP